MHHKASSEAGADMNVKQHVRLTKNATPGKVLRSQDVNEKHNLFQFNSIARPRKTSRMTSLR